MKRIAIAVWGRRHKLLRFLISGGSSTTINFFCLYAFTEWIGFHYLQSVTLAFVIAISISFALQKFWTFRDRACEKIHHQLLAYTMVAIVNLGINLSLVYGQVEYFGFHYMLAQLVAGSLIALESYFIYQHVIFKIKIVNNC